MTTTLARRALCCVVLLACGCGSPGRGAPDARDGVPSPLGTGSAVSPLPGASSVPVLAPASPCASLQAEQLVRVFTPAEQTEFDAPPPTSGQNSVSLSCEWSSLGDRASGRLKVQVTRVGPEPGLTGAQRAERVHGRCDRAREKPVLEDMPGGRPACFTRSAAPDQALSLELRGSAGDQLVLVSAYRAPGTQIEAEVLDAAQEVLRHVLSRA